MLEGAKCFTVLGDIENATKKVDTSHVSHNNLTDASCTVSTKHSTSNLTSNNIIYELEIHQSQVFNKMDSLSETFSAGEAPIVNVVQTAAIQKETPAESNSLTASKKVHGILDQHLFKVAGPHQLDKRRQKQQETVEKMFPHIAATHKQIGNALAGVGVGTMQQKLMKAIKFYISGCSKEYEEVNSSTQKCRRLARSMSRTMDLLHEICSTFEDSAEYIHRMSELVAIYVSCELRSANEFKENKPLISNRICNNIYKHLKARNEHDTKSNILRMFVYMPKMHSEREVMTEIYKFFIPKEQIILQRELPDKLYIQYLIVFYHWKKLEFDAEEQMRVIEFANKFMRPAKTLCANHIYAKHLPKYGSRQKATKFILQNLKYFQDLRNASIYDNQIHSGMGVIDLSDEDIPLENSVFYADFASIVKNVEITPRAPPIKHEKQIVTATIDLTLDDDKDTETDWLETLKMNAIKLQPSRHTLTFLACRTAAITDSSKNKPAEIIELDSDSDLDLEEPEQISSNYLDFESEQIGTLDCLNEEDDDLLNTALRDNDSNGPLIISKPAATEKSSSTCLAAEKSITSNKTTHAPIPNLQINSSVDTNHADFTDLQNTQINPEIPQACNITNTSNLQQQTVTQFTMPRISDSYSWRRKSIHISSSPNNTTDITSADRNSNSDEIETDKDYISTNIGTKTIESNSSKVIFSQTVASRLQDVDFDEEEAAFNTQPESSLKADKPNQKKQVKFNDNLIVPSRANSVQHPIKPAIKTVKHNNLQSTTIFSTAPLQRFGCSSPASSTSPYSETIKQIAEKGMKINSLNKLQTYVEMNNISIISTQPTINIDNPIEILELSSNLPISNSNNIENSNINKNTNLKELSICKNLVKEKTYVTQAADISSTNCDVNVDNCVLNVNYEIVKKSVEENFVKSIENYNNNLEVQKETENTKVNNISSTYIGQDKSEETTDEIINVINKDSGGLENGSGAVALQSAQSDKAIDDLTKHRKIENDIVNDNKVNQLCCVSTSSINKENMLLAQGAQTEKDIFKRGLVLSTDISLSKKIFRGKIEKEGESCGEVSTSCSGEEYVNGDTENESISNSHLENQQQPLKNSANHVLSVLSKKYSNSIKRIDNKAENDELEIQTDKNSYENISILSSNKNSDGKSAVEINSQRSENKSAVTVPTHFDVAAMCDIKISDNEMEIENLIKVKEQVKSEYEHKDNMIQEADEKALKAKIVEHKSDVFVLQSLSENIMSKISCFEGLNFQKIPVSKDRCCVGTSNEKNEFVTEMDNIITENKIKTEAENKTSSSIRVTEVKEKTDESNYQNNCGYVGISTKTTQDNSEGNGKSQSNFEKNLFLENIKANVSEQSESINKTVTEVTGLLNESSKIFIENKCLHDTASSSKNEDISSDQDKSDILLHDFANGENNLKECDIKDYTNSYTFQLDKKQSETYFDIDNRPIVDIENMCNYRTQVADIDLSDNIELHVRHETYKGTGMEELDGLNSEIPKDQNNENANVKRNDYEQVINQNPQILNIVTKCMDIEKLEENIKTMRRELQLELEEWNETTKEFIIQQQPSEDLTEDDVKGVDIEEPTDFYGLEEFLILHKRRVSQENSDNLAINDSNMNEEAFDSNISEIASNTPPYTCVESSNTAITFMNENVESDAKEISKPSGANIATERGRTECEIDSDLEFDFDFVFGLDFDSMTPTSTTQNIPSTKELYYDKSFLNENSKTYEAEKLLEQFNVATENIVESVLKTNETDEPCLTSSTKVTSSDDSVSTSSSSSSSCKSSCSCSTCPSASKRRFSFSSSTLSSSSSASSLSQNNISSTGNHDGVDNRNHDGVDNRNHDGVDKKNHDVLLGPLELENELLLNADDLLPSSELITDSELLQEFVTIPSMGTKLSKPLMQMESSKKIEDPFQIETHSNSVDEIRLNEESISNDYEITWHSGQTNVVNEALDDVHHEGVKPILLVSIPTKNLKNLKTLNLTPSIMGQENKKHTQELSKVLETSTERSILSVSNNKNQWVGIDNQGTSETIKGIIFRVTAPKRRISDFSIMQLIGFNEEQTSIENYNHFIKGETKESAINFEATSIARSNAVAATTDSSSVNDAQYVECDNMPISRRVLIQNITNSTSPFIDQQQVEITLPLKKRRKLSEFHDESSANSNTATLTEEEDTDTDDNLIVLEASNGARTATHLRRSVVNSVTKSNSPTASASDESQTVYIVVQSVTVKSPDQVNKTVNSNNNKPNIKFPTFQQSEIDTILPTTATAPRNSLEFLLSKEQDINSSTAITLNQSVPQSKPILLPINSSPPQNKQIQVVTPQVKEIPKVVDSGNVTSIPESYPAEPMLSIANFENLVHLQKYLDSLIASKHIANTVDAAIAVTQIFKDFHELDTRPNLIAEISKITTTSEILDTEKHLLKIQLDGSISILVDNNNVNEWMRLPPATAALLTKAATTLAKLENYKKQLGVQTNLFVQSQELQLTGCNPIISVPESVNASGDTLLQMRTHDLINKTLPLYRNVQFPKKENMLVELQLAEIRIKQEQNKQTASLTNLREIQTATVLPLDHHAAQLSNEKKSIQEESVCATAPNPSIVKQQQIFSTKQHSSEQHVAEHNFPVLSRDGRYYTKNDQLITEEFIDHHVAKVIKAQTNLTFSQTNEKIDCISSRNNQTMKANEIDLTPFFNASSNFSTANTQQANQNSLKHTSEQHTTTAGSDINLNRIISETNATNQYFQNVIARNQTAALNHNNIDDKNENMQNLFQQKGIEYPKMFDLNVSNVNFEKQHQLSFEQQNYIKNSNMPTLQQQLELPTLSTSAMKPSVEDVETIDISQLKLPYSKSDDYQPFYNPTQSHNTNIFDVEAIKSPLETCVRDFEYYTFEQQHQRHMLMLEKRKQFEQMIKQREVTQQQLNQQRELEEQRRKQREIEELQRKQQRELEEYEQIHRKRNEYVHLQNQKRECEKQQLIEEVKFRKLNKASFKYKESQHNIHPKNEPSQRNIQSEWQHKSEKQQQSYQQQMEEFVRLQQQCPFPSASPPKISSPTIPEAARTQPSTEQPKRRRGRQTRVPRLTLNLITNINNTTTIDLQNTFSKINATSVPSTETSTTQSSMPRKRGRPRKSEVNIEPFITTTHSFKQTTTTTTTTAAPVSPTIPNISFSNMLYPPPIISTRTAASTSSKEKYNSFSIYTPLSNFPMQELAPILTNVASHKAPMPCKRRRVEKTTSTKKI